MVKIIHAIYENGVFRPIEPVELPDHCAVEVEVRNMAPAEGTALDEVYAVLGKRFNSGVPDVAARHDEHQP